MEFRAENSLQAARERMTQAGFLSEQGRAYALAMYSGGLAVEGLLRAYR